MYIDEEAMQLMLWHLDNSLDRCVEEGVKPPAASEDLMFQLAQVEG